MTPSNSQFAWTAYESDSPHRAKGIERVTLTQLPISIRETKLSEIEAAISTVLSEKQEGMPLADLLRVVGARVECYEDDILLALAQLETRTNGDLISLG